MSGDGKCYSCCLILFNMITGFVAGSETIYDNVGGGAIVTREGAGICVFVGANFAGKDTGIRI